MAEHDWKWLNLAGNGWKWKEWQEMARNGLKERK